MSGWLEAVRPVSVEAVATELGLAVRRRALGPCPACGAERRGGGDTRGPCGLTRDGHGFRCFRCDAAGDAADLVALRLTGSRLREATAEQRAEVRAWYAARGWCEPEPGRAPARPPARPPRVPVAPVEPAPAYPPAAEVEALWSACAPLDAVSMLEPAVLWLEHRRGLLCRELAALDLVRVLPSSYPWPAWVPTLGLERAEWRELYRLAVPMYDAEGALRGLRFRLVDAVRVVAPDGLRLRWTSPDGVEAADGRLVSARTGRELPKSLSQRGGCAGLVMPDVAGLELLRGAERELWDAARVVVAEGEVNAWSYATAARRPAERWNAGSWAVLGFAAGGWTAEVAARIPDGARVSVSVDDDEAGRKYLENVRRTLAPRCPVVVAPRLNGGTHGEG